MGWMVAGCYKVFSSLHMLVYDKLNKYFLSLLNARSQIAGGLFKKPNLFKLSFKA
jgi:hypothetical protein